jgi:hypothetical protein
MCAICAAHAPDAFSARARDRPVVAVQVDDLVVGEDPGAVLGGATGERPHRLPGVDRPVRHRERALDLRVEPRLALERLADRDLLGRELRLPAALHEPVAVRGVVVGRDDEQAAGVLDAVGDDAAQDRVLGHALLRRDRILDHVAAAGVQQAVEAAARALGEVRAIDERDVEPAQRGIPGNAGTRGAAADDQDVSLEARHTASLQPAQRPKNVLRVKSWQTTQRSLPALVGLPRSLAPHSAVPRWAGSSAWAIRGRAEPRLPCARVSVAIMHPSYPRPQGSTLRRDQSSASNQSKVRVTAFFQYL